MALRDRKEFAGLALIVAGFVLVGLVIAGYLIGAYVDRRLGTAPLWALVGLVLGFLVGFWDLYLLSSRILAAQPSITPAPVPKDDTNQDEDDW